MPYFFLDDKDTSIGSSGVELILYLIGYSWVVAGFYFVGCFNFDFAGVGVVLVSFVGF